MLDPIGDLYQYLSSNPDVTSRLGIYAGSRAIFAGQIPPDHEITDPVIILDYPLVNLRTQTSSTINRDIQTTLRVYAQVQFTQGGVSFYNTEDLQQASEALAASLVTARIPIQGGILRGALVKGPINAPVDDKTLAGRLITVRWRVEES